MAVRIKQSLSIYIIGVLVVMTSFAGYLYMPEKAEAAFTFVNSGENGSSASNTSLQATVTGVHAGDLVVILAKWENGDTTVSASDGTSSFTDALSGNHAVGTAGAGEPNVTALYLLSSVTSGSVTYTVTWGAARPWKDVIVAVYTPGSGTLSLDGTANKNVGAGTSLTTGNITTSGTDGIAFALYGEYGTGLDSEKINGLVADRTIVGGVVNQSEIWIKSYTSGFTGQGTATLNSSNNWAAAILAFKLTASGGGGGGATNSHINVRGGGTPATPNNPFVRLRGGSSGGGVQTPTIVQHCGDFNFSADASCTLSSTPISGHLIVATAYAGTSGHTWTISGCGNNWAQVFTDSDSDLDYAVWTTTSNGSSCTPTVSESPNDQWNFLHVIELSGTNQLDTTPAVIHPIFCTTCSSNSIIPATNGSLIVLVVDDPSQYLTFSNFTNSFTIFNQGQSDVHGQGNNSWVLASLVQSSAASISTSWNITGVGSGYEDNIIMAFKAAGGTGGSVKFR